MVYASSARACSVRTLICASRARSVGRSRSPVPVCSNLVSVRCLAVASTAARHKPLAIAAVPTENHGRITSSLVLAPSPSALTRSALATGQLSRVTDSDSLPRKPSPSKLALILI